MPVCSNDDVTQLNLYALLSLFYPVLASDPNPNDCFGPAYGLVCIMVNDISFEQINDVIACRDMVSIFFS